MDLMQARMAVALGLSTAAHAGFVWMLGDRVPSSAAPAQRAMTVSMAPAAPRAVLNSIAPSATSVVSPTPVRSVAPRRVAVVDEPDERALARPVDVVQAVQARRVVTLEPEKTLRAREPATRLVTAVSRDAEHALAKAVERESAAKPLPAKRTADATQGRQQGRQTSHRVAAAAPPAAAMPDASAAAGQPGADRVARPAAGNEPPKYPWSARVHGDQGRVVVSVWVSAEGKAERLAVLQSSGHAALDRAAVEAVEHWRFEPARRAGAETASMLYVPVIFRLE